MDALAAHGCTTASHTSFGAWLVTAADLLGHSSLTTTRRYAKASVQELEAAIEVPYDE